MAKFMLLLYENPEGWKKLSPEEMQTALEKYMAWAHKPFTVDSQRLASEPGRILRPRNGRTSVTDGPYSETKEILGGYYTIEAADYDAAIKLALEHPHLEYGGVIELRHVYGS